jgi:hypothetical protein
MFEHIFDTITGTVKTTEKKKKNIFSGIFDELVKAESYKVTPTASETSSPFKNVSNASDWTKTQPMSIASKTDNSQKIATAAAEAEAAKKKSDWQNSFLGILSETFAIQNLAKAAKEILLKAPATAKEILLEGPAQMGAGAALQGTGGTYTPETGLAKFILGDEPVKELSVQGSEILSGLGMSQESSQKYGGVAGFALLGLNFVPGSGEANALMKELKPFTKIIKTGSEIAESVRAGEVSKILLSHNLPESFLPAYSKLIANATSQKEVESVFNGISKALKEYSPAKNTLPASKIAADNAKNIVGKEDASTVAPTIKNTSNVGIREIAANEKAGQEAMSAAKIAEESKPFVSGISKGADAVSEGILTGREVMSLGSGVSKLFKALTSGKDASSLENLAKDTQAIVKKVMADTGMNVKNLNISDEGKAVVTKVVEDIKPQIENSIGEVLTNKEAIRFAENSSKILEKVVGRESTLEWEASLLKARQKLSLMSESGKVDQEYIDTLRAIKTNGTDIARKLQSLNIDADPKENTTMQSIVEAVLKVNQNTDDILKAAEGVDFTDLNQASEFYRTFVKPTASEWIDLLRYNSMLSSPLTHIVNTFSNLMNTIAVKPIEKALAGGFDFLGSKITGRERAMFAGEGGAYAKGYFDNAKAAVKRFNDVMQGKKIYTNLDVKQTLKRTPIAVSGKKGVVVKTLSFPLRMMEASDQLFTALSEGGETAALQLRASKGVKVGDISTIAQEKAAYTVYRQGLDSKNEGVVLNAVDQFTKMIQMGRNSKNPVVSTISKFTLPFVQTPMNIFKQGIEYSPLGVLTMIGREGGTVNKTEQLAKAVMGSAVFTGAATLLSSNRLSWTEPMDAKSKADYRAAGKQPYSIKIGDNWVSFQKLPPVIAFPFAMVASIDDLMKNKKIDDDAGDLILSGVAKFGSFLADQSYVKSIGDLLAAAKGDEYAITRAISNYPQQLIPFRALGGWMARLADDTQHLADNKAGHIEQQIQWLMTNMPGLSQTVPARIDSQGDPVKNSNNIFNSLSPMRATTENMAKANAFEQMLEMRNWVQLQKDLSDNETAKVQPLYNEIQRLKNSGDISGAKKKLNELTDSEYEIYKKLKTSDKTKQTNQNKQSMLDRYLEIQNLINTDRKPEAQAKVNAMTDEEYAAYKLLKNQDKSRK